MRPAGTLAVAVVAALFLLLLWLYFYLYLCLFAAADSAAQALTKWNGTWYRGRRLILIEEILKKSGSLGKMLVKRERCPSKWKKLF